ncbi:hypothetical protein PVL29_002315 [Vitis rotundifolia]|uniref:Plastid lipid-associated protein/fibrillin conserved domain-containing protein n=2 Tax=Vitis rotundifolia TaxID=103349 RepID=A0AA39E4Z0_VITRO|nr:hypothetical protein PVL29_002315 [Vitis rotundifolia]
MAMLLTSHASLFFKNPKTLRLSSIPTQSPSLSFAKISSQNPLFSSIRLYAASPDNPDSFSIKPPSSSGGDASDSEASDQDIQHDAAPAGVADEWGEKAEPEPEPVDSYTKLAGADPPRDEDEWGGDGDAKDAYIKSGNGIATAAAAEVDEVGDLKRCLVDTVYGTNFGFEATAEVRAEVVELVNQLEAANPTPAPTEAAELLDGNWVLLYTAASELLPLLAAGSTPLLKVKSICQSIETSSRTIVNSTTLSSPFATFSFSASATFEVRSPSRIQVQFKEGTLQPPEIKSSINLPENVDVFGQKISLSAVQQSLNPLQEAVASISQVISGQPPLKVPIPGERSTSWLLITYLDKDIRISRGDGGLFVLAKEASPLLDLY